MKNTQVHDRAWLAQATGLAKAAEGGYLEVQDASGKALARWPVVRALGVEDRLELELADTKAHSKGEPTNFVLCTKDEEPLISGSAGTTDANMILPIDTIVKMMPIGCERFVHHLRFNDGK